MNALKTSISALALMTMAAGGIGAAMPANVFAQTSPTTPATAPDKGMHHHHGFDAAARERFLEGRIAFLKAVLKITPAQEQAFNGFADAMRANFKDRAAAWERMRADHGQAKTAVDRLQTHIDMIKLREQAQERVLAALKPLYAALSPDQQTVANHLAAMVAHRGHHGGHGHRG
jgi:hypothetical protein